MKLILRCCFFLLTALLPVGFVLAQDCRFVFSGKVMDGTSGKPLDGALIVEMRSGRQFITDKSGAFRIPALCDGTYRFIVSFVGYAPQSRELHIHESLRDNFVLYTSGQVLQEVKVNERRASTPLQVTAAVEQRDLELNRGKTLGEALKSIPGLSSVQTGPNISKPMINGMMANRVVLYNAGVKQEGQQWGNDHAPEIDPFIADRMVVVKGAASVAYGADAMGGVILAEPSALRFSKALTGGLSLVGAANNGLGALSLKAEKAFMADSSLALRLIGTLRGAGNSRSPQYWLDNTGMNEQNIALLAGYRRQRLNAELYASSFNTKIGIFSGSHIGNITDLLAAIGRENRFEDTRFSYTIDRPYQVIGHHLLRLKAAYRLPELGSLTIQYSFQKDDRREYDRLRGKEDNSYQLRFDLSTHNLDVYAEHEPMANLRGRIGVNGTWQQNYYDGRYLIPFFHSSGLGLYAFEKWSAGRLSAEAGLRYDTKHMQAKVRENVLDVSSRVLRPEFNYGQLSGTLGASYAVFSHTSVGISLAKAWRPPSINELFIYGVHHSAARFEEGDRDLKEESAVNLNVFLKKHSGRLKAEMSWFYNTIDDFIYLKPLPEPILTVRGAFNAYKYRQVDARFAGINALTRYEFAGGLQATATYAMVRAKNTSEGRYIEYIPADRYGLTLEYALPETDRHFHGLVLSAGAARVDRQHLVKPEQDIVDPPPGYTLFNASVSSALKMGSKDWKLSLSAENLLNKKHRDYLNLYRYFADDTGINITARIEIPLWGNI